ncbi:MAG: hypothetical protein JW874_02540 [Spirochaetales bacterium]|nr:hypothetical protein [Spirochaetales bacterium]
MKIIVIALAILLFALTICAGIRKHERTKTTGISDASDQDDPDKNKTPSRNLPVFFLLLFSLLACFFWIDEIFDLSHYVFGAEKTPANWQETVMETVLIMTLGFFVHMRLLLFIRKNEAAGNEIVFRETRYRITMNSMMEACQIISRDLDFLYLNDVARNMMKVPDNDSTCGNIMSCLPAGKNRKFYSSIRNCLSSGRSSRLEHRLIFAGGKECWCEINLQAIPEGLFILMLDISKRKRAEFEWSRLYNELVQKNTELEQVLFATSHDLRSPLVNVQGFTSELKESVIRINEIIMKSSVPPDLKPVLDTIIGEEIPESLHYILIST